MVITDTELTGLVASYVWPFIRIGAMFAMLPFLGARTIPVQARLLLAVGLTVAVAPLLPSPPAVDPISLTGMLISIQQVVIGIVMSFGLQMLFSIMIIAGQVVANSMGLGFASMVDPQNGVQVPLVGQLYLMFSTLMFLAMDGHLVMIQLLVESFALIPIGLDGISRVGLWELVSWASYMFAAGVLVAIPIVTALLLINLSFGVITRAAPQLNIFAVGFPISLMVGIILIWVTLPNVLNQFEGLMNEAFMMIRLVVRGG